jgi:hypothetical protein
MFFWFLLDKNPVLMRKKNIKTKNFRNLKSTAQGGQTVHIIMNHDWATVTRKAIAHYTVRNPDKSTA